ncbi:precorrin-6A reductase [Bacillus massiliigorillae]|uniref:precorrin-6A reductase n=1 Tax=Bacillus massiliigorillae TaxID=1243664 RepID=UPI00039D2346|nr:precorrin-6A reductase [Bacillus massiliigorillae]
MILVFGGTSDSLEICHYLEEHSFQYVVSVATEYGGKVTKQHTTKVIQNRMSLDKMLHFMKSNEVTLVIDATHPFATEVSINAMAVCEELDIPYIRFERPQEEREDELLHVVEDLDAACKVANHLGERIFLTTGSKNLADYLERLPDKHVIARVLPITEVIHHCEQLGLIADQIVAMKGPFSKELNKAIFQATKADVVITKEAGRNGGFQEKVEACLELHIPCVIIQRPKLDYPKVVSSMNELVTYLYHHTS